MAETIDQSILVVDDNPDDRHLSKRMLEGAGVIGSRKQFRKRGFDGQLRRQDSI